MVQEPAGAPQPADRVPREPVTLGVAPAHVLALAGRHVVHHVQVVVLGDVAGPGREHATLVRHRGRSRRDSVLLRTFASLDFDYHFLLCHRCCGC